MLSLREDLEALDKERKEDDIFFAELAAGQNLDWESYEIMLSDAFEYKDNVKTTKEAVVRMIHSQVSDGYTLLELACMKGHHRVIRLLLTIPELDVRSQAINAAIMSAIETNSIKCFEELTKCERIDWNMVNEDGNSVFLHAAYYHRVEMLQALSKVQGVNWNCQVPEEDEDEDPTSGFGVAHCAISTLEDSCYQILDILLDIHNFDISLRSKEGDTALTLALKKRDFKSIIKLFTFPFLDLDHKDFDKALQETEDLDKIITECFKANKETGYNFSDAVDFLREHKKRRSIRN